MVAHSVSEITAGNSYEELASLRPAGHRFSLGTITSVVFAVCVSVPVRTAARAYAIFEAQFAGTRQPTPSYSSVRNWLLRVGVYQLTVAQHPGDDWVYIVDHSVQVGCGKMFIVLGIRLRDIPEDFRLQKSQVNVVHLEVMDESNQHHVKDALDKAAARTGPPCQIVSDSGSDIKAGIGSFQNEHPDVIWSYDIHHKVAAELKKLTESGHGWPELCAALAQFKVQTQQTPIASLAPPAQRGKARYMNIDVITTYIRDRLMPVYQNPEKYTDIFGVPVEELKQKLAWLADHVEAINLWECLSTVGEFVRSTVNQYGYGERSNNILDAELVPFANKFPGHLASTLIETLVDFVEGQSLAIPNNQRLLGSSEIVESMAGVLKNLLGNDAKNGFTSLVVGLAAMTPTLTPADVMQALTDVNTRDAHAYARALAGPTVQQARRKIRETVKSTKNHEQHARMSKLPAGYAEGSTQSEGKGAPIHHLMLNSRKNVNNPNTLKKEQNMGKRSLAA